MSVNYKELNQGRIYYITTVIYVSGKIDLLCFRFDLLFIFSWI